MCWHQVAVHMVVADQEVSSFVFDSEAVTVICGKEGSSGPDVGSRLHIVET